MISPGRNAARTAASLAFLASALVACGADTTEPPAAAPSSPESDETDPVDGADSQEPGTPTGTFKVDGRKLHLECVGEGKPTMILEVGEGAPSEALAPIQEAYASQLKVCTYDRANTGQSAGAPTPRTGEDTASDLHGLLEVAKVPGPYLLVGHSAGGLLVQDYAALYPGEVAGVVALNPVPPWDLWSTVAFAEMTAPERQGETDYFAGANGESLDYRATGEQIADLPVPQDVPFHVLISTIAQCSSPADICGRTYPAYEKIMKGISRQWSDGRMSQVEALHDLFLTDMPAVQRAIDDVLSRAGTT